MLKMVNPEGHLNFPIMSQWINSQMRNYASLASTLSHDVTLVNPLQIALGLAPLIKSDMQT